MNDSISALQWRDWNLEFEACLCRPEYEGVKRRLEEELGAVYGVAWFHPREAGNFPYPCFRRNLDGAFAFTANDCSDDAWWEKVGVV